MTIRPDQARRLSVVAGALVGGCALAVWSVGGADTIGGPDGRRAAPRAASAPHAQPPRGEDGIPAGREDRAARPSSDEATRARSQPRPGRPRAIAIPAIGVRAPIVPVETTGRVLVPPDDVTKVGWWGEGARPGARTGSAVLTGHTVSAGGGVFDDLDQVAPGDRITVTTTRGRLRFVVEDVVAYRKPSLPEHARRLFSQSVPGRLVLVTCENWNGEVHLSNQIVVAPPA